MSRQTDITIRPYTLDDIPAAYEAIMVSVKEIQPFLLVSSWLHPP